MFKKLYHKALGFVGAFSLLTQLQIGAALPALEPTLYKHEIDLPQETIYEMVATQEGLGFSVAIADIVQSEPHYHVYTIETYVVLSGVLEVMIDDQPTILHPGDALTVPLLAIHSAKSLTQEPARIMATCVPGWTQEDHLPAAHTISGGKR